MLNLNRLEKPDIINISFQAIISDFRMFDKVGSRMPTTSKFNIFLLKTENILDLTNE